MMDIYLAKAVDVDKPVKHSASQKKGLILLNHVTRTQTREKWTKSESQNKITSRMKLHVWIQAENSLPVNSMHLQLLSSG